MQGILRGEQRELRQLDGSAKVSTRYVLDALEPAPTQAALRDAPATDSHDLSRAAVLFARFKP
jgi:hypothetical protein